jgi:hypothetical protein
VSELKIAEPAVVVPVVDTNHCKHLTLSNCVVVALQKLKELPMGYVLPP